MARQISQSTRDLRITQANRGQSGFDITVDGWRSSDGASWRLDLVLKEVKGRLSATQVQLTSEDSERGVTTSLLSEIPMHSILLAIREHIYPREQATRTNIKPGSRRGRILTDEDHSETARLYREAISRGFPVQRYLAERLEISSPAAAQRVQLARRAGALEPVKRSSMNQRIQGQEST